MVLAENSSRLPNFANTVNSLNPCLLTSKICYINQEKYGEFRYFKTNLHIVGYQLILVLKVPWKDTNQ